MAMQDEDKPETDGFCTWMHGERDDNEREKEKKRPGASLPWR